MSEYTIDVCGFKLEVVVTHEFEQEQSPAGLWTASDWDMQGYRELDWHFASGADEIGEKLSFKQLDFIAKEYESDLDKAIWKAIKSEDRL
ncbi:MAG: hypothetical protein [Bacteriophage sp.]|nr:MAG: hypothetical protein [Bacteriophage sp.]